MDRDQTKNLIEKYYTAFNQDDMKTFLSLLDENVAHDINQGSTQIGRAQFEKFMQHMNQCYKEHAHDLVIMVNEDGSRASAEFIIDGIYINTDNSLPKAHGQEYSCTVGTFFEINKNGKIQRVTNYYNMQDWLNQVK